MAHQAVVGRGERSERNVASHGLDTVKALRDQKQSDNKVKWAKVIPINNALARQKEEGLELAEERNAKTISRRRPDTKDRPTTVRYAWTVSRNR